MEIKSPLDPLSLFNSLLQAWPFRSHRPGVDITISGHSNSKQMEENEDMRCCIVMYPSPVRSHLMCMLELAKLLLRHYNHSLSITVLISSPPHLLPSISPLISGVSASTPFINFHHLPTISSSSSSASSDPAFYFDYARLSNPSLHRALFELSPKPKALILDFFYNPAFDIASSLHLPTYYLFPSGANALAAFLYFPTIHETTTASLKDLDTDVVIPGLEPIPAKHMPTRMLDRESKVYGPFLDVAAQLAKAAGLISNTFERLEPRAVEAIRQGLCAPGRRTAPFYCVGPFVREDDHIGGRECLSWLDLQPSRSVLFLTFGSIGLLSSKQLREIAHALERSERVRFLWVVRAPPPSDEIWRDATIKSGDDVPGVDSFSYLPYGFSERTKHRGMVVESWAPQAAVLSHRSVGGFVNHCGWASFHEAVFAGVPMIMWPLFAEQKLNRAYLAGEMKIVLSVTESEEDGLVSAAELEERIAELMFSETGRRLRERMAEMKSAAMEAIRDGGTSRVALAKLVDSFIKGKV